MLLIKKKSYFFCAIIILFLGVIFLFPAKVKALDSLPPEVKIFKNNQQISSFYGFLPAFRGGVRVAAADVDGDGGDEIIVGAGPGGGPNVQIFDENGHKEKSFMAYDIRFRRGIKVASCDVNGDGKAEIITAPEKGGGPNIKVFDRFGHQLKSFMAYDERYRGGINVACGDITGDGRSEIITGPGISSGPQVRVFDEQGNSLGLDVWAFDLKHRGGVSVAAGNLLGQEKDQIITAVYSSGRPIVKVFDDNRREVSEFLAYDERFSGGVNLACGDIDNDGLDEIITGANAGGGPHVRSFEYDGKLSEANFFPYPRNFHGGVFVAVANFKDREGARIITGPGYLSHSFDKNFGKYIEVNITRQRLSLWQNGLKLATYIISSGRPGMDTPTGIYKIISKLPNAYSSSYALYMPYWQQFTPRGHGLHGLPYWKLKSGKIIKEGENHLGIRVSHGCVRLSWEAAKILYNFTEIGTPVVIHY